MASAVYDLFRRAILDRQQIVCMYDGYVREICPHILGHTRGVETVLAYQFGGGSKTKLPPEGEWRCLALARVQDARIRPGGWHTGHQHRTTQRCVMAVDVDVNV